jgi:putative FmdB family regulatory protein
MPLYEYECENGHRFEKIQKFSDPPIETCPTCGATVRKLMSSPAIQFKGSGWYVTDYAKKDGGASKSEKSEKSETKASGETKTESASETKAEKKAETKADGKPASS